MRYAYELTYEGGIKEWNFQSHLFTNDEMLNAFKPLGVVAVKFHRHIPRGYHLCGCGNLVVGENENVLCQECREIYGHAYESNL